MALLQGKPLVFWALEVALESGVFDGIIISSDDDRILDVGSWGSPKTSKEIVVVAHKRSPELATDTATVFEVCREILEPMKDEPEAESFVVLLPTSPLRSSLDIWQCHEYFNRSQADCLMSAVEYDHPPDWALRLEGAHLAPRYRSCWPTKRQDLIPLYRHDGSIIMANTAAFLLVGDWMDLRPIPFFLIKERAVDINEPDDLLYAEFLLSRKGVI